MSLLMLSSLKRGMLSKRVGMDVEAKTAVVVVLQTAAALKLGDLLLVDSPFVDGVHRRRVAPTARRGICQWPRGEADLKYVTERETGRWWWHLARGAR